MINAASKALGAQLLISCLYWNHKHGDQMHGWLSGKGSSNPLEIEHRPTNLSEEILASSRQTDMLKLQQSRPRLKSLYSKSILVQHKKQISREQEKWIQAMNSRRHTHKKTQSKHRASHTATKKIKNPTKQKLFSKSSSKTKHYIKFVNKHYLKSSRSFPLFYLFIF